MNINFANQRLSAPCNTAGKIQLQQSNSICYTQINYYPLVYNSFNSNAVLNADKYCGVEKNY